jgi:hypothetical protein
MPGSLDDGSALAPYGGPPGLLVGLCLLSHDYVNIRGFCRQVSNGLVNHVGP